MDRILDYSFKEVSIVPPSEEKFFQLFCRDIPLPFVYSESHLKKCLGVLVSSGID